jgi:putative acetyltransferase
VEAAVTDLVALDRERNAEAVVRIRDYRVEDLDGLLEVFIRAIRETASRHYTTAQVEAWAQTDRGVWERRRAEKPTWVAEVDGEVAGFTDLEPDGHVDMLYVHPNYGGRGVARRLLQTVEAHARTAGINQLYTEASLAARPVFDRQGFEVVEQETVRRNGQDFVRFKMRKHLKSDVSMIEADGIKLVAATVDFLNAEDVSGWELARMLGVEAPASWPPMFNGPETRQWVRDALRDHPCAHGWNSWYIIAETGRGPMLAGICGYKGPPDPRGQVEIGYSVVPEHQRRGLASVAIALLCDSAFSRGATVVVADTLPELVPSQRVLAKNGFLRIATIENNEDGTIWRYRRQL